MTKILGLHNYTHLKEIVSDKAVFISVYTNLKVSLTLELPQAIGAD